VRGWRGRGQKEECKFIANDLLVTIIETGATILAISLKRSILYFKYGPHSME
jgi:hypothetical protein